MHSSGGQPGTRSVGNYLCSNAVERPTKEVAALIEGAGRKALALPGEIVDEAWRREMVAKTVAELGGLDILLINAGRQQSRESIGKITSKDFDTTMKVDMTGEAYAVTGGEGVA